MSSDLVKVPREKLNELISVVRSINRGKQHEIRVRDDDDPCYWQRKEWVDWALEVAKDIDCLVAQINDELPNDLPGGWTFDKPFSPEPLAVGQVWRKAGPGDAVKVERVMQPGQAEHDGGLPGISVRRTEIASKVRWKEDTEFWPGPVSALHERLREGGYALAN